MRKVKDGIWIYKEYDVYYSPDESGYYAAQGDKCSRLYKSLAGVKKAIDTGKVKLS